MTVLLTAFLLLQGTTLPSQTGVITGLVRSMDGAPAAEVRVAATPVEDQSALQGQAATLVSIAQTDSEGRYRLENIPPGRYHVMAGFLDFPTYHPSAAALADASVVTVAAGATARNVDIALTRPAGVGVTGRVVQAEPSTTTTYTVHLNPVGSSSNQRLQAVVRNDGSFEFSRVAPGNYNMTLTPGFPGFQPTSVTVDAVDIAGLELFVPVIREISGRIRFGEEGPRPRFALTFTGSEATVRTSAGLDGTFRLRAPQGEYRMGLSGFPFGYNVTSMEHGATDLATGILDVTTGDVEGIVISVQAPPPEMWLGVRGRVELRPGPGPIPRTAVLGGSQVLQDIQAPIGEDGSFEFPQVLPGTYTVRVQPFSAAQPPVTLHVNRNLDDVVIALPAQVEIVGRVVMEDGGPLPRLNVSATGSDGRTLQDQSEADGTFSLIAPEGEYRIELRNLLPGLTLKSITDGATDLLSNPLRLREADKPDIRIAIGPSSPNLWKKVSGSVTVADGASTGAIRVTLIGPGFNFEEPVRGDGSFEFPRLLPGSYTLSVRGNRFVKPATVVVADSDVGGVVLSVPRQARVEGRIIVEGGGPIPRINLAVSGVIDEVFYGISGEDFRLELPEGEVRIAMNRLPSGYEVRSLTAGGADLLTSPLRISAAGTPPIILTVAPKAGASWRKLRGRVWAASGTALPAGMAVLIGTSELSAEASVRSDGSFEFPRLLPGSYTVRLRPAAGLPPSTVEVGIEDVTDFELRIPPRVPITGRIVVEGGGPLPRGSVIVDDTPVAIDNPAPDGSFTIQLPVGEHRLNVSLLGTAYSLKSVAYDAVDVLLQPVRIDAAKPQPLLITVEPRSLSPWRKVRGRVPQAPGAMQVSRRVVLGGGAIQMQEAAVAPDGSFEFPRIPPGNYFAYLQPLLLYSPSAEVAVGDSDVAGVELKPPEVIEVKVRIRTADGGDTAPSSTVMRARTARPIRGLMGMSESVETQGEGPALQLVPGEYRVTAVRLPAGFAVDAMTYGPTDLLRDSLRVEGRSSVSIDVVLRPIDPASIRGPAVGGRVRMPAGDGTPRPAAVSFSATDTGGVTFETPIEADGSFGFPAIPPGAYDARLIGAQIPPSIEQYRTRVVVENTDLPDVELNAVIWAEVTGQIVVEGKAPLPDLKGNNVSIRFGQGNFAIGENVRPDGSFEIALVRGTYQVSVGSLPAPYYVRSIAAEGVDLPEGRLLHDATMPVELLVTLATP